MSNNIPQKTMDVINDSARNVSHGVLSSRQYTPVYISAEPVIDWPFDQAHLDLKKYSCERATQIEFFPPYHSPSHAAILQ